MKKRNAVYVDGCNDFLRWQVLVEETRPSREPVYPDKISQRIIGMKVGERVLVKRLIGYGYSRSAAEKMASRYLL